MKRQWQVLTCFILIAGSLAAWAIAPVTFDDSFISYRYAQNFVEGHGLVFNPGERVEGYTNFLWVIISAAAIRVGIDPFESTRALGLISYVGCVVMAFLTSLRIAGARKPSRVASTALLVAVIVVSRDVARIAGSGLETFFVTACLLGTGVVNHVATASRKQEVGLSVLPLLAVMARLDALLGIAASMAATVAHHPRGGLGTALVRRYSMPLIGVIVLTSWRSIYYGALLPNSFHAKGAAGWHLGPGLRYLFGYAMNTPSVAILIALAAYGLWASWRTEWRGWQLFLSGFVLLHTAYVAKVGGDFMHYRLMFEALPLLVCAAAVGLIFMPVRSEQASVGIAIACLLLSVTPRYLERSHGMQSPWEMDQFSRLGHEVGNRLNDTLPSDTVIATTLAGTVPYYSRLTTIDQWGLNDRFVASLPEPARFVRGHLKRAPIDYLVDRHVNLIIDHPTVCPCDDLCREDFPQVFVRLSDNRCLRTSYLVQRPELTRRFCDSPQDFLLHNVPCP